MLETYRVQEEQRKILEWLRGDAFFFKIGELEEGDGGNERARELLLSCLSPTQKEEFNNHQYFTVISPSGNRYMIRRSKSYNVSKLNNYGMAEKMLCAGPSGISLPTYDCMLAQKCLLEADENEFLKVANSDEEE